MTVNTLDGEVVLPSTGPGDQVAAAAAPAKRSHPPELHGCSFRHPQGWDPATATLSEWAVTTVVRDHPYLRAVDYGPEAATLLIRTGRVALFLDGLDEMPSDTRG